MLKAMVASEGLRAGELCHALEVSRRHVTDLKAALENAERYSQGLLAKLHARCVGANGASNVLLHHFNENHCSSPCIVAIFHTQ